MALPGLPVSLHPDDFARTGPASQASCRDPLQPWPLRPGGRRLPGTTAPSVPRWVWGYVDMFCHKPTPGQAAVVKLDETCTTLAVVGS